MLTIDQRIIDAAKDAVRFFRYFPDANAYIVYGKDSRDCSDMDVVALLFLRDMHRLRDGYSSPFTVYDRGYRGAVICEKWIAAMVDAENAPKIDAKETT